MTIPRPLVFAAALVAYLFCSGHNGGCHPDEGQPLPSPVQALAVVVEAPDGSLWVELTLVSNAVAPAAFVAAVDPWLHTPDATRAALIEMAPGRYRLAADDAAQLPYALGDYTLGFSIAAEEAQRQHVYPGDFVMAAHGPADVPVVQPLPPGDPDGTATLHWEPAALKGLVQVRDAEGALQFDNLLEEPGAAGLPNWSALQPGQATLPVEALAASAGGSVQVCAVELVRPASGAAKATPQHLAGALDSQLGSASGMLVGRCTAAAP